MKYYLKQSRLTQPKNRAQKHLQEFMEKFDGMLANSEEELARIIERTAAEIAGANAQYRNCTDIAMKTDAYDNDDSVNLWLHAGIESSFVLLNAWKVFKEFDGTFPL
jgi:hypothetical protein